MRCIPTFFIETLLLEKGIEYTSYTIILTILVCVLFCTTVTTLITFLYLLCLVLRGDKVLS